MPLHRTCDGMRRRDFLKVGVLTGTGLTLAQYLQLASAGQVTQKPKATNAIFINLGGGPSHMDTFDLKPNAASEYRGEFNPIETNAAGVQISQHLPKLATVADKFAILRGVSHTLAAHELGTKYMNTGNRPIPSLEFPAYGSVVSKEMPVSQDLPQFVAIPNSSQSAGYLGLQYGPLSTGATPRAGTPFSVRGITLGNGLTVRDVQNRQGLLNDLDNAFSQYEKRDDLLKGLDQFSERAYSMISSEKARLAFDTSRESPEFSKKYGETSFGQSCLLATRLVESGVRFVTVGLGGWDTHAENFPRLKDKLLPDLDTGLAALYAGLAEKGLLESTVVMVTGEFGRTPKINAKAGRDHWPRAMFVLMAGGGIRGGQAIGASDDKGMGPAAEGIKPDDIAATYFSLLGIDSTKEYHTNTGRPVMIVREGSPIPALTS